MSAPIPTFLYGAVPLNDSGLVASWRRGNPESDSKGSKYPPVFTVRRPVGRQPGRVASTEWLAGI